MESEDGFQWKRPECGLFEHNGDKHNSIVHKTPCFIGGGCGIFRDPGAEPAQRYKMVAEWANWDRHSVAHHEKQWTDDIDPRAYRDAEDLLMGVRGAVSPDGLHWTVLPDPLVITHCDTQIIRCCNQHLGEYVSCVLLLLTMNIVIPREGGESRTPERHCEERVPER